MLFKESMNYLQDNKVNYIDDVSAPYSIFYDNHYVIDTSLINIVKYTDTIDNIAYSSDYITVYINTTVSNTSTKVIECTSFNDSINSLLYNISITLSSSDFTAIPDDAKVSFTISVNDTTIKQVTFDVQPYVINTYNFFDVVKVNNIKSFTISASSTTPLIVYDIQNTTPLFVDDDIQSIIRYRKPMNCFVYM